MKEYRRRIADDILTKKLRSKGAILIEGPKWCGKTTTGLQQAKSVLRMDNPDDSEQNLSLARMKPSKLLIGDTPRLIDEWQIAPKLWDAVRYEVDSRGDVGQFMLTGSAVPPNMEEIKHSGTGRFSWLMMRTMSLFESGESTGEVSLAQLFNNPSDIDGNGSLDIDEIAYLVCRGGWPQALDFEPADALQMSFDYVDGVIHSDINRSDGYDKNQDRVLRIMRSLARHQGTQTANTMIAQDIAANDAASVNEDTVHAYISALKKIFVVEDMVSWNPNLRSKSAIRSSDTRYYTDPSIATACLGIGPNDLINDLKTFGLLFETLCVRDLRVYAQANDGHVYHYRDSTGLECDAVIHLRNGKYGLAEIKLGGDSLIAEGAKNLLKLRSKIDTDKMGEPSFMMIVTGVGRYAYRREDGIFIVPIGCLRE